MRILIILARLNANATTVARPVGVKPIIKSVSVDQKKCSCQLSVRGLNKGTSDNDFSSKDLSLSDFWRLQ